MKWLVVQFRHLDQSRIWEVISCFIIKWLQPEFKRLIEVIKICTFTYVNWLDVNNIPTCIFMLRENLFKLLSEFLTWCQEVERVEQKIYDYELDQGGGNIGIKVKQTNHTCYSITLIFMAGLFVLYLRSHWNPQILYTSEIFRNSLIFLITIFILRKYARHRKLRNIDPLKY